VILYTFRGRRIYIKVYTCIKIGNVALLLVHSVASKPNQCFGSET